jgi:hypothetical protein
VLYGGRDLCSECIRFEVSTAVKIHVLVTWAMTLCDLVSCHQHLFYFISFLWVIVQLWPYLGNIASTRGKLMEALCFSETLVRRRRRRRRRRNSFVAWQPFKFRRLLLCSLVTLNNGELFNRNAQYFHCNVTRIMDKQFDYFNAIYFKK